MEPKTLKLPVSIITPTDLGRLLRELAVVDEELLQLGLRQPGTQVKLPKTTLLMDELVSLNKLSLLQKDDRARLKRSLETVRQRHKVIHISFSAEPSVNFLVKLMVWLRREVDPYILVTIGLQPSIAAGCVVRTSNKVFDFSLRENFAKNRGLLRQAIMSAPTPVMPAPTMPASPQEATT